MPQDELWACSARLTGYRLNYRFDLRDGEQDQLTIAPTWSKQPAASRDGGVVVTMPTYMRWYTPALFRVAHDELLGGLATNLPGVVRAELSQLRHDFQEGLAH